MTFKQLRQDIGLGNAVAVMYNQLTMDDFAGFSFEEMLEVEDRLPNGCPLQPQVHARLAEMADTSEQLFAALTHTLLGSDSQKVVVQKLLTRGRTHVANFVDAIGGLLGPTEIEKKAILLLINRAGSLNELLDLLPLVRPDSSERERLVARLAESGTDELLKAHREHAASWGDQQADIVLEAAALASTTYEQMITIIKSAPTKSKSKKLAIEKLQQLKDPVPTE